MGVCCLTRVANAECRNFKAALLDADLRSMHGARGGAWIARVAVVVTAALCAALLLVSWNGMCVETVGVAGVDRRWCLAPSFPRVKTASRAGSEPFANSRFAVVQVFVPVTDKWKAASADDPAVGSKTWLARQSQRSWREYCRRHGYRYVLFEDRQANVSDMPVHFDRFVAVRRLLQRHEWVLYADSDVVVQRFEVRLSVV